MGMYKICVSNPPCFLPCFFFDTSLWLFRTGAYTIAEADGVTRGTKIIISLLEGQDHFAKKQTIESILFSNFHCMFLVFIDVSRAGIIKKYSNFVGFPIKLNGERVNTVRPLWTLPKHSISEEDHKQFYQFLAHSYDLPIYRYQNNYLWFS